MSPCKMKPSQESIAVDKYRQQKKQKIETQIPRTKTITAQQIRIRRIHKDPKNGVSHVCNILLKNRVPQYLVWQ